MKKSIYLLIFVCCTYASIAQNRPIYISVEDMINNFRENKRVDIDTYDFLYSSDNYLIVTDSLLPQISGINSNEFQGEWTDFPIAFNSGQSNKSREYTLYLRKIKTGENKEIYVNKLEEKYGKDRYGIPARWFSGKMSLFISPQVLFGEIVAKCSSIFIIKNGVIVSKKTEQAKEGEMEGEKIAEVSTSGSPDTMFVFSVGLTWHNTVQYDLSELDTFVNKGFQRDTNSIASGEYSILLVTNESGEADGYLLEPEKLKSIEEKQLINKLLSKIESLPLWSFGWLYTIDGSIFQGRYIKANYSSDQGWNFIDYVMILDENQNISE